MTGQTTVYGSQVPYETLVVKTRSERLKSDCEGRRNNCDGRVSTDTSLRDFI